MTISSQSSHRPWPIPNRPWVMKQTWNDLLFAHWPIPPEWLKPLLPANITMDTYEGMAWIGVVPFWMSGVGPRGIPAIPILSTFAEINLRTYVTLDEKPGVYFFSLDANRWFAVELARLGFHLPYFHTDIQMDFPDQQDVRYHSTRKDRRANPAIFEASYRPISDVFLAEPRTLEHWLTERYCLYCLDKRGNVYRGEIDHPQWKLQLAEANIQVNSLPESFGITLPDQGPLLHFAKKLEVRLWLLDRCRS